jgi:prepilin-type N-terminal cleavage/methylation domain-containing protein
MDLAHITREQSTARISRQRAGFSLIETLIALAIAVTIVVPLVRLVMGTRLNAARVDQMVEMSAIADTLLTEVMGGRGIKPGQTEGRRGSLSWRIDIAPMTFRTTPLSVVEKSPAVTSDNGLPAASASAELSVYRVAITLNGRAGEHYSIETLRIGVGP